MGDELGRSQGGNNNTWCQDNPLGWMDWNHNNWDHDLKEFVLKLISLRKQLSEFFSPDSIYDCQKDNTKVKTSHFIPCRNVVGPSRRNRCENNLLRIRRQGVRGGKPI